MNINVFAAIPEMFMVGMIMLILMADAFIEDENSNVPTLIAVLTLLGGYILQLVVYNPHEVGFAFNKMFVLDSLAEGMKLVTYVISIVLVVYIKQYIIDRKLARGAFYSIFLFAVLGMQVLISANTMLVLYVGLELLSLALYGLIAMSNENPRATEAAMKFFILGALASGILLYGISFIYGATGGQIGINEVSESILALYLNGGANHAILVFGLVFVVAGLMFKLGLVPFHMWVPDVYEGSNTAVTSIIGTVTKVAAVVFVYRFLIEAFAMLNNDWAIMLSVLACLSLFIGNIVAISQTNIKRMLAYSTIAHMGFVAFGFMTRTPDGLSAVMFYIITYVFTALAGFGVLLFLSGRGYECENIEDLSGLNKTHPIYAGIMLLVMFSLAGIPPLVGFYAKFKILEAMISAGYLRSAIFAVVLSLIGAFYYLRVVKVMYFDDANDKLEVAKVSRVDNTVLIINGALILVFGVIPSGLIDLCSRLLVR
jgi:NADH-quinone oxidoreductase subunit N